jgi:integrase/recombinase XerD
MDTQVISYQQYTALQQADSDAHLVALWLHGKAASTQEAYEGDIARFMAFVDKPLYEVRLGDVQTFVDSLQAPSDYTRARRVASVKSLLSFGHKLGYLPFDVGRPIKTP